MSTRLVFAVLALSIVAMVGCERNALDPLAETTGQDSVGVSLQGDDPNLASTLATVAAQITYFSPASGDCYPNKAVTSYLRFKNTGTSTWTFWVGYSVQDRAGKWYDIPTHSVTLGPGQESTTHGKTWYVPSDPLFTTGYFKVAMAVWRTRPESGSATRLAYTERANSFQAFNFVDRFDTFSTARWYKGAHTLGRSYLDPNNVSISSGYLAFKFPAGTYNGAEIGSNSRYKYGTYIARMKCPQAAGSFATFFLYQDVSGGNDEIDIEIYNDGSRRIDFVVWARGTKSNYAQHVLAFDPSAGYHEYRIDFYPREISFYVDGKLLQRWTSGLPTNSMRIMSNAWWPAWLYGPKPTVAKYTYIDWIRH